MDDVNVKHSFFSNRRLIIILLLLVLLTCGLLFAIKHTEIGPDNSIKQITFQDFQNNYLNKENVLVEVNNLFVEVYLKTTAGQIQNNPEIKPNFYFGINSVTQFLNDFQIAEQNKGNSEKMTVLFDSRDNYLNRILNIVLPVTYLSMILVVLILIFRIIRNTKNHKSIF